MSEDTRTAKNYRERAQEMRTIAATTKDEKNRKLLMTFADDYEYLASRADRSGNATASENSN
jgi:hypothetical protein